MEGHAVGTQTRSLCVVCVFESSCRFFNRSDKLEFPLERLGGTIARLCLAYSRFERGIKNIKPLRVLIKPAVVIKMLSKLQGKKFTTVGKRWRHLLSMELSFTRYTTLHSHSMPSKS